MAGSVSFVLHAPLDMGKKNFGGKHSSSSGHKQSQAIYQIPNNIPVPRVQRNLNTTGKRRKTGHTVRVKGVWFT